MLARFATLASVALLALGAATAAAQEAAGLFIAGTIINHPLQAEYAERFAGFGAWTRTNGAVLYVGADTYADPSF